MGSQMRTELATPSTNPMATQRPLSLPAATAVRPTVGKLGTGKQKAPQPNALGAGRFIPG